MDFVFLCLLALLILVLVAVRLLNSVPTTNNIETVFRELLRVDPTTRAFCLGRRGDKYVNAVLGEGGQLQVSEHEYPVRANGSLHLPQPHGDVINEANGFRITGMELVDFRCPPGHSGPQCEAAALCGPGEEGQLKALSREQFVRMALYSGASGGRHQLEAPVDVSPDDAPGATPGDAPHPSLRVRCGADGPKLEACPPGTLLDPKSLECERYDICRDHRDGYRHTERLPGATESLGPRDYYTCAGGRSEPRSCDAEQVYSAELHACVSQNECLGRHGQTLPLDDHHYVVCRDDEAETMHCTEGVVRLAGGRLTCRYETCTPQVLRRHIGEIKYDYGEVRCKYDEATQMHRAEEIICDDTLSPQTLTFDWYKKASYRVEMPRQVYAGGRCVDANFTNLAEQPIIELRVPPMESAWPFNLATQQFVCESPFRWDIRKHMLEPPAARRHFFNTGDPCPKARMRENWTRLELTSHGRYPSMPALVSVPVEKSIWPDQPTWPTSQSADDTVICKQYVYDYKAEVPRVVVTLYTTTDVPKAFLPRSEQNKRVQLPLKLGGYGRDFRVPPKDHRLDQFYHLNDGVMSLPKFDPAKTKTETREFELLTTIDLHANQKVPLFWDWLPSEDPENEKRYGVQFVRHGVRVGRSKYKMFRSSFEFLKTEWRPDNKESVISYRGFTQVIPDEPQHLVLPYMSRSSARAAEEVEASEAAAELRMAEELRTVE